MAAAVRDPDPRWWDDDLAVQLTGGLVVPETMVSTWFRPDAWQPAGPAPLPLPTHFDVKAALGFGEALVVEQDLATVMPVLDGATLTSVERLRSVGEIKRTRLGTGRFWTIDVDYRTDAGAKVATETVTCFGFDADRETTTSPNGGDAAAAVGPAPGATRVIAERLSVSDVVAGAFASHDHRPVHHDPAAAQASGAPTVFLDTPTQQAWFRRAIGAHAGPGAFVERLRLRMGRPICAGDDLAVDLVIDVVAVGDPAAPAGVQTLSLVASVDGVTRSTATAQVVTR
jgi:acyl dehydratase